MHFKVSEMGRKLLDRDVLYARIDQTTNSKLKQKAALLGLLYNGEGAIGKLLDAIASEDIVLVPKSTWEEMCKKKK